MTRKIFALFLFVSIVFSFASCGKVTNDSIAVRAGDTTIDLKEFRYHYNNSIGSFRKTYPNRKDIDFSISLDEQQYGDHEDMTWADYFVDYTVRSLKNYCVLAEDARINGTTLSENDILMIDDQIKVVEEYLSKNGISEAEYFGEEMAMEDYRASLERNLLGSNRYYEYIESLSIPYESCAEYAKTKPQTYMTLNYYFYNFRAEDYNASYNEARTAANTLAKSITNVDDFEDILYNTVLTEKEKADYVEGDYYVSDISFSYLDRELQAWGYEEDREIGDYTLVTGSDGIILYVFAGLDFPSHLSYDLRLIYVPADKSIGSEEGLKQAEKEAESILTEWENGQKDEDSFASLAYSKSSDAKTFQNGGLSKNTIVSNLGAGSFDWISSLDRVYGDVGMFSTDDGVYLIYYIGQGLPTWQVQAESVLKANEFNQYIEDLADKYNFTSYKNVVNKVK